MDNSFIFYYIYASYAYLTVFYSKFSIHEAQYEMKLELLLLSYQYF